jgi:hypothetical protein
VKLDPKYVVPITPITSSEVGGLGRTATHALRNGNFHVEDLDPESVHPMTKARLIWHRPKCAAPYSCPASNPVMLRNMGPYGQKTKVKGPKESTACFQGINNRVKREKSGYSVIRCNMQRLGGFRMKAIKAYRNVYKVLSILD